MKIRNVKFGEVITHRKEFITIDNSVEYKRCRVQVNRKGIVLRDYIKGSLVNTKKQQVCREGDFIVAEIDAKVGGYGFVPTELKGAIVSSHYFIFEVDETKMLRQYLGWLIKTDIIQDQISSKGSTNYAAIRPSHVLNFEIPLPSIDEQRIFVQRLDKIEAKYLLIKTEIENQQIHLRQLREALLREAVLGKLVQQDNTDDPANRLLSDIIAAKQKQVLTGKSKKRKPMEKVNRENHFFELPKGWVWCTLNELGIVKGGGTPSKNKSAYWYGTIPWITPKDMKADFLADSEDKITIEGVKHSTAKLIPANSVLIVGRSGILKRLLPVAINTVECTVNQDLKVLVPYLPEMARYIQLMLQGHQVLILKHLVKYGMTVHSLKYREFELHPFPLPPLAEQHRIIIKVDQLMEQLKKVEEQIRINRADADQLLQTILREAFFEKTSSLMELPTKQKRQLIH